MTEQSVSVVGIGAAACAGEALRDLVRAIPAGSDAAWVVIAAPGLSLLSPAGGPQLREIAPGMRLERGTVFVAPHGATVTLEGDRFAVTSGTGECGPVDAFLVSLAEAAGRDAGAVLLHGLEGDGARGIGAVAAAGGRVIVQGASGGPRPQDIADALCGGPTASEGRAEALSRRVAELEALYDMSPVGLALLDRAHRFVYINETLAALNGYPAIHHIGKPGPELLPQAADKVSSVVDRVFATGEAQLNLEFRTETPAMPGVARDWIADLFPVMRDGEVVAVGSSVREVTERRKSQRSAHRNEARLKKIFDAVPALIALYEGENHVVTYCNPLHDRLLGAREIMGKPLCEAMPEFADPDAVEKFNHVLRSGETVETEELAVDILRDGETEPERRYFWQVLLPHENAEAGIAGVMSFAFDVTELVSARQDVDRARSRLQTLQDSLAAFVGMLEPDGTLTQANETALASAGLEPEEVIGKKFWDTYWWKWHPDTQARLKRAVAAAAKGETVRYDAEVRVRDGAHIIIDFQLVPVVEADGSVSSIIPSAIDITQRRAAEEQLRETLAQHQAFFENAPVGLAMMDLQRRWIRVNPAFARIFGIAASDHIGKRPDELVPDVTLHPDPIGEIRRTGGPIIGYELRTVTRSHPDTPRDLLQNFFPILVDGELRAVGKSVQDVTARKAAEAHQELLIAELQHRVKNILATVQSVARFTARHSSDKDEMVRSLQSRLSAIARTHDGLTREQWTGQWLRQLIRNEVMAYDSEESDRVRITGDDVHLAPAQAMSFGLALHELATNAAKYGALSVPRGRLEIDIATGPGGGLRRMVWQEQDGPPLTPPTHEGFGSFLLEKVLGAELGAEVETDFAESGLRVKISVKDEER